MSDETLVEGADDTTPLDEYEIKLRRESEAQRTTRLRRSWGVVCSTPEGRAVLWDIMDMAGMNGDPMVAGLPDLTAANIGAASVGRKLQRKVNEVGKRWALLMVQENI